MCCLSYVVRLVRWPGVEVQREYLPSVPLGKLSERRTSTPGRPGWLFDRPGEEGVCKAQGADCLDDGHRTQDGRCVVTAVDLQRCGLHR